MPTPCQSTAVGTATMTISTRRTTAAEDSVPMEKLTDDTTPTNLDNEQANKVADIITKTASSEKVQDPMEKLTDDTTPTNLDNEPANTVADIITNTASSEKVQDHINYQAENNWTVQCFVSHRKENLQVVVNRKKKKIMGYVLQARWIGFQPEDDTMEPIHTAAEYHRTALIAYIKQVKDEQLIKFIAKNEAGILPKEFQDKVKLIKVMK